VGLSSLVDEANSRWEEAIFVARGFGPEGPQPPARGECLKEFSGALPFLLRARASFPVPLASALPQVGENLRCLQFGMSLL